ncbi:MAG: alpha-1,4-glucan--maltose-1-phosphate maltosyltransferase [Gemmatimonadales bacterium]
MTPKRSALRPADGAGRARLTEGSGADGGCTPARVVIERVTPEVDAGRFAAKRVVGDVVVVEADVFAEGHDRVAGVVRVRGPGDEAWQEATLEPIPKVSDRWQARFAVDRVGTWEYTVEAWVDDFATWRHGLERKVEAGQSVSLELVEGAELVREAAGRADGDDRKRLAAITETFIANRVSDERIALGLSDDLALLMARCPDRSRSTTYTRVLPLLVERERARYGAWYELFPRSCAETPGGHGTLQDCIRRLPYVADMGFDVLYLPPIHPIGRIYRKGRNNTPDAEPGDVGSPWAIGAAEGGHTAVHPELGTIDDFDQLVAEAGKVGLEVALDIAFQATPDHPWVKEHPEWFKHRADGSIQYAENPPKKYQDIYPLNFESPDWKALWEALRDVVLFWADHGVRIFRIDNPHTKPFAFWEWMIAEVRRRHPDAVFLSEAFTRPKVMRYLAKSGFSQSYTYFTWRNTKVDLEAYFTELTRTPVREYLRPNLFVNTPDILHEYLQTGHRPAFEIRLVLAATLGASYGIYGPAFEMIEDRAVAGTEEYLDSEKYQLRHWDLNAPGGIRDFITRVNTIRRDNPALHVNESLQFFPVDNEAIIAYAKTSADGANTILTVVNLDPHHAQIGWIELPLDELGLVGEGQYQMHDLLGGARFLWQGPRNYVSLDPATLPAHIFRVRRRLRTERDFDYYL